MPKPSVLDAAAPAISRRIASNAITRRADEDQHPLDRRREVLDLLVAVAVALVGRLAGLAHGEERDDRGDQVDRRVHAPR